MELYCPACGASHWKKNGFTKSGKQNHKCLECGRQFVLDPQQKRISEEERETIRGLLKERISLRGICRVMKVSMDWLLAFLEKEYEDAPDDLHVHIPEQDESPHIDVLPVEGDELWSFVGKKENKQWIWLAQDRHSRQIVGYYVGDRSKTSAQGLWDSMPQYYQDHGVFYTDQWDAYQAVFPTARHHAVPKQSGQTGHIERLNNTLRQRISRLVRKTLSFSKKLLNHIGTIKYFICDYNVTVLS